VPVLLLVAVAVAYGWRADAPASPQVAASERAPWWQALTVVRRSRYLVWLWGVVGAVQIAVTLIDFRFNQLIEQHLPSLDERTSAIGAVYGVIDVGSLLLQLISGLLLKATGLSVAFVGLPVLMGIMGAAAVAQPGFLTGAAQKISSKCFDYSLFRAIKELLYIPLSYEEKVQGKALVDVLTYRVAKTAASFLLLLLGALSMEHVVGQLILGITVLWWVLAFGVAVRYKALANTTVVRPETTP
jgi:ATP/ADP translocase